MSDENFVINVNGYIGESTKSEIEYAKSLGKRVNYLEDKFAKHNHLLEEYAESLSEDLNGLEILPMGGYALIKPFEQNPF